MTKVAITGHRPEKLGDLTWLTTELTRVLAKIKPETLYQGMAAGVDLLSAEIAYNLDIPFVACKPWAGHTPRRADEKRYAWVLDHAREVVNVSEGLTYDGPWLYHNRNHYMVDHADTVVAVWDGEPNGGTYACVKYARDKGLRIVRIDPIRQTTGLLEPRDAHAS